MSDTSPTQPPVPPAFSAAEARGRERALVDWRRLDCREEEGARQLRARCAVDLVPHVLQELRVEQRVAESQIVQVWDRVVDPAIAAHARPSGLVRGTLFVDVDSPVWLAEIVRYRRREILERIRHVVGAEQVQRISFRPAG